jgi:hypothetical protein
MVAAEGNCWWWCLFVLSDRQLKLFAFDLFHVHSIDRQAICYNLNRAAIGMTNKQANEGRRASEVYRNDE